MFGTSLANIKPMKSLEFTLNMLSIFVFCSRRCRLWATYVSQGSNKIPQAADKYYYNKALLRSWQLWYHDQSPLLNFQFLSLTQPGGELLHFLQKAARIIVACCVLHKKCIERQNSSKLTEDRDWTYGMCLLQHTGAQRSNALVVSISCYTLT